MRAQRLIERFGDRPRGVLRDRLAASRNFRVWLHEQVRFGPNDVAQRIDVDASDEQRVAAFDRIRSTWEHLGASDPHWSVLTAPQFRSDRLEEHRTEFDELGRRHARDLVDILRRHGVNDVDRRTCLEYGCGVGRTTRWLAEAFDHVTGYDISKHHLGIAEQYLVDRKNATLRLVNDVADLNLASADVVYSVIVLQHNPPIIIDAILGQLLDAIAPGGIAVIQIPTYASGYVFDLEAYLAAPPEQPDEMEMHVLPQHRVFSRIRDHGCELLEVFEDTWNNLRPKSMSNTFVIRRPE